MRCNNAELSIKNGCLAVQLGAKQAQNWQEHDRAINNLPLLADLSKEKTSYWKSFN